MPLLYDFNNDGIVSGADVVYFASRLAGLPGYNINNLDENTNNKLVQYKYLNLSNLNNYYVGLSSEIIDDFSLNITPVLQNSKISINVNLNYLTSCYPNTFLKLELYYRADGVDVLFSSNTLGTENTSFMRNLFNLNSITIPSYTNGSTINYYIKASIYSTPPTNGNVMNLNNLDNQHKPQLLFNELGNSIILSEYL